MGPYWDSYTEGFHLSRHLHLGKLFFHLTRRRVFRIELKSQAWKASVIPLYDTRTSSLLNLRLLWNRAERETVFLFQVNILGGIRRVLSTETS